MEEKTLKYTYANFRGLWDKDDSGLIPSSIETGVFASSIYNVICEDATITMEQGYTKEKNGTTTITFYNSADSTTIRKEWLLYLLDGQTVRFAWLNNGKIVWYNSVLSRYEVLLTSLTSGVDLGLQEFNTTTTNRTYFCDGTNNLSFWNKAVAYYASDNGANEITVTVNGGYTTLASAGFGATGTIVLKDGTNITYTGLSTLTFTGCSAVPAAPAVGDGIAQRPDTTTLAASPKGNVLFSYQARLGVIVSKSTVIRLSKVADGTDFATAGVDGTITMNIIDGNGNITAAIPFKKRLIIFKLGGIIPVQIIQLDSTTLRTTIEPLLIRSNIGPTSQYQVYSGTDEVYWISGEGDIKQLTSVTEQQDVSFNAEPLGTQIKRALKRMSLISTGRITVDNRQMFITGKSSSSVSNNDTLIQYDVDNETFYFHRIAAGDFWYDENNYRYFTSASELSSYRFFDGYDANGASTSYLWRSGRLDFNNMFYKKETNLFVVFGRISSSSVLNVQIDYNSGGLNSIDFDINGDGSSTTDGTYILTPGSSSAYGNNVYGIEPYGGSDTDADSTLQYFLAFKKLPAGFSPYDVTVQFSAQGTNRIKIISFGLNPTVKKEIPKRSII